MRFLPIIAAIIIPAALYAEDIAKPTSLSIRAKEIASRNKETYRWRGGGGTHDKTTERSRVVEVEVTNFGGKPAPGAKVIIYWIGGSGGRFKVIGRSEEELHLNEIRKMVSFESPDFTQRSVKYYYEDYGWAEGDKLAGYVVTLSYQEHEYPVEASGGVTAIRTKRDLDELIAKSKK